MKSEQKLFVRLKKMGQIGGKKKSKEIFFDYFVRSIISFIFAVIPFQSGAGLIFIIGLDRFGLVC